MLFEEKAFLAKKPNEAPFKLASGGSSYIFFDCKQVTQDPEGIYLIAELIFDAVSNLAIDSIGGIQTGAIPICTAVALVSHMKQHPIQAYWVRQEKKSHGTEKWIEGNLEPSSRVVVVDDVTTKGNSVFDAIERVREIQCEIVEVISLVDREEGARERITNAGYQFASMFTISDFSKPTIAI
ncbi:MAG: orotate phosphoribosyltransferase [Nitrososphaerales archaeon]